LQYQLLLLLLLLLLFVLVGVFAVGVQPQQHTVVATMV
jgi:hypothetical protein